MNERYTEIHPNDSSLIIILFAKKSSLCWDHTSCSQQPCILPCKYLYFFYGVLLRSRVPAWGSLKDPVERKYNRYATILICSTKSPLGRIQDLSASISLHACLQMLYKRLWYLHFLAYLEDSADLYQQCYHLFSLNARYALTFGSRSSIKECRFQSWSFHLTSVLIVPSPSLAFLLYISSYVFHLASPSFPFSPIHK